jgi:AcrR family transcriptional regulator
MPRHAEQSPPEAATPRRPQQLLPEADAPRRPQQLLPEADAPPLPVAGQRRERADAVRNRQRVLLAARELFDERGVENVTMEEVARRAGVAKGTVFHRFGDRSGLALALLDEHERELQDAVLRGAPPLGPGAPALDRLLAFLDALVDLLERHGDLLYAAETGKAEARYRTGAYDAWHQHVAVLLGELGVDGDPDVLAHAVLAPFAAELYRHLRVARGVSTARVRAAVHALARGAGGGSRSRH